MTLNDEQNMHIVAQRLVRLTSNPPWTAMQYFHIGQIVEELTTYCAVCDCTEARNKRKELDNGIFT